MQPGTRRILLVDDSELTLLLEEEILTEAGHQVRTATSLAQVRAVLESWSPEIILTDVNMPEMNGGELCRRIKAQAPVLVPVILFSSLTDEQLAALAAECGADGYLSKAHGVERLAEQFEELCQQILW